MCHQHATCVLPLDASSPIPLLNASSLALSSYTGALCAMALRLVARDETKGEDSWQGETVRRAVWRRRG